MRSPSREQSEIRTRAWQPANGLLPDRFSHGVHANSESAHARTLIQYKSERQVLPGLRVQVKASHRITSHRIASHRIVSYRHNPWGHRRITPPFLPFTCLHIRLLEGRKSFQFSLAVCLVAGRFPFSRASTLWRLSKSAVWCLKCQLCRPAGEHPPH